METLNLSGSCSYDFTEIVSGISRLHHSNIAELLGYCSASGYQLLVYELQQNGSLHGFLHLSDDYSRPLTWDTRVRIALGTARAIDENLGPGYSAPECTKPAAYSMKSDVYSFGVVMLELLTGRKPYDRGILDENIKPGFKSTQVAVKKLNPEGVQGDKEWLDYNPKLSDFGLAKEGPMGDETHVSTQVVGTEGYAAPEYITTGKKAMDKSRPSEEHNLVNWAHPFLIHTRKLLKIIDPRVEGQYSRKAAMVVAGLVHRCLSQLPKGRPTMNQVVETLESIQELPECREDMLLQSGGNTLILFEAPKVDNNTINNSSTKKEDENKSKTHDRRRTKYGNGRSKSERPMVFHAASPSP
ncbi:hypothetical protein BHE74_00013728 [Ensete ventricosum]|nr:hypothetical protein BHE74_00013728 [Ensete ventricosum]